MLAAHRHGDFPLSDLLERKRDTVSAVLPARECATTVAPIVEGLRGLEGLVDQVLVVDAASADGTADVAAAAGAEVVQEADLAPDFGPVLGKGDAMWRSLRATRGELVVFLDADTPGFETHFATGLLGPLLHHPEIRFVKAAYRRPFSAGGVELADEGGRVSELCARPLLAAFWPPLAAFSQPLAGEVAARRELLERIPFATGYAVELAMLLAVREEAGIEAMAEVDLGERRNAHQPLADLGPMAYAVLAAALRRLRSEGRLEPGALPPFPLRGGGSLAVSEVERPPLRPGRTSRGAPYAVPSGTFAA